MDPTYYGLAPGIPPLLMHRRFMRSRLRGISEKGAKKRRVERSVGRSLENETPFSGLYMKGRCDEINT